MSIKKVHDVQPEKFEFSKENLLIINNILKKYPSTNKKSAVMPLLYIAQKQNNNWIPLAALNI
jgi:NADH:ubiquinone oxidoreductase 24 kD subunit